MADKLTRSEWNGVLEQAAIDAAAAYRKYVEKNSKLPTSDEYEKGYKESFKKFLESKYPYEDVTNEDMVDLSNFSSDDIWKWEAYKDMGDSYDPRVKKEKAEFQKFMPLLKGVANDGEDWYSRKDLMLKGAEMGFDYSSEGLGEFMKKLEKYQTMYDRAKLVKEMRDDPMYIPTALFYPKLTQGIENAVATGSDLSKADAVKLGALDAGTNAAIFAAPSATILKSKPILNAAIDSGIQGGVELGRQYGAQAIDPSLTPDASQAIFAASAGATRPVLIGTVSGAAAQVPGKAAQQFSRGVMKSTRAGNPVWQERDNVFNLVNEYYKRLLNGELKAGQEVKFMDLGEARRFADMNKVPQMAQELGIKANKNGTYSAKDILKAYDRKPLVAMQVTDNGVQKVDATPFSVGDNEFVLNSGNEAAYRSMFPAKYVDEQQRSPFMSAGLATGRILGDVGGRVEPMLKITSYTDVKEPDYKKSSWYKNMSEESRKIVDQAFRKKMEQAEK